MGGWYEPESGLLIAKDIIVTELENEYLTYFHDQMHIYWQKLSEGFYFEWTFNEVYEKHTELIIEMKKRGVKHIFPINNLDNVPISPIKKIEDKKLITLEKQETYSVEKKMNGFHVQVHKKGDQIKIFSEHKKDLTIAFPTLVENIKKLSTENFIIDGELVPYDNGKTLGRNVLMKYIGFVRKGNSADDKNIKLHIWDIPYFNKSIIDLSLSERINILKKLKFNARIPEIERKIVNKKELKEAINWASGLPGSEGALVKETDSIYSFGESSSWKKYRKLSPINVMILKVVPKERNLFNYLVGIPAAKKFLDPKYIENNKLVLGHTFNTKEKFKEGDVIQILIEEVWRHKTKRGIHYSIHKPRVKGKINEAVSGIDKLEDLVTSIGVEVTHSQIDGQDVLISKELAEKTIPKGEGKEIQAQNFPNIMQNDFKKQIGKWGDYVMQVHTRGKTLHYDIRHKTGNFLNGITLFGRSTTDRLRIESQRKNIRSSIKLRQPLSWLVFEGTTEKSGIGATKRFPGIFTIVSKGKFTIHEVTDHVIRIEYKSDSGKINKKMLEGAKKNNIPYASDLPENLINLNGKYSWHIAHIGEKYLVLFDKLVEK